MLDYSVSE
ncbi:hypothetical protein SOVF_139600, partial [Spinacia oleracea]